MCSLTIERVLLPMPDKVKDVVELQRDCVEQGVCSRMCSLTIECVLLPMPDKVKDVVEL